MFLLRNSCRNRALAELERSEEAALNRMPEEALKEETEARQLSVTTARIMVGSRSRRILAGHTTCQ